LPKKDPLMRKKDAAKWYLKNKKRCIVVKAKYLANNKEKVRERERKYQKRTRDQRNIYRQLLRLSDPKYRKRTNGDMKKFQEKRNKEEPNFRRDYHAKKTYGEFWESAVIINEIRKESRNG